MPRTQREDNQGDSDMSVVSQYHLPSKAEISKTRRRIEEIEKKIIDLDEIMKQERIDRRKSGKKLTGATRAKVEAMKAEHKALVHSLNVEKQFIAPIRLLPVEIFNEIFTIYAENGGPTSTLCLVARSWNHIASQTPALWQRLSLCPRFPRRFTEEGVVDWVKLRIARSGSRPLHVTTGEFSLLKFSAIIEISRTIIPTTNRWQSLELIPDKQKDETPIEEIEELEQIFSQAEFRQLRSLRYPSSAETDQILQVLMRAIGDRAEGVTDVNLIDYHSSPCFPLEVFRNVTTLTCSPLLLPTIALHSKKLKHLKLNAIGVPDHFPFIDLSHLETLFIEDLQKYDEFNDLGKLAPRLTALASLHVGRWRRDPTGTKFYFPAMKRLQIDNAMSICRMPLWDMPLLDYFSARIFVPFNESYPEFRRQENSRDFVMAFAQTSLANVRELHLDVHLTTGALLAVLGCEREVAVLDVRVDERPLGKKWMEAWLEREPVENDVAILGVQLIPKKQPFSLCPNLTDLTVRVLWDDDIKQEPIKLWIQKMRPERSAGGLARITCVYGNGKTLTAWK